jgi:hypothetical protein
MADAPYLIPGPIAIFSAKERLIILDAKSDDPASYDPKDAAVPAKTARAARLKAYAVALAVPNVPVLGVLQNVPVVAP